MPDLSRLNKAQLEAVKTIEGGLLLLAGAGTGKTTVITYRIAYMLENDIAPHSILALTFTNKAATEMKERVVALVGREKGEFVTVGTFHSFCLSVLKKFITRLGFDHNFSIADDQLQTRTLKQVIADPEVGLGPDSDINPGIIRHYISQQKQNLVYLDNVDDENLEGREYTLYLCWKKYQQLLKDQSLIDFDDLIVMTIRLFWDFEDVQEHYQERFKYMMVDEYQDTNLSQLELLRMIAGKRQNICAVGDDDQSIYGWRGADISNILEFEQHFDNTKVIRIEENYRCSGKIIAAANKVIANNSQRYEKTLRANASVGEDIRVVSFDDEHKESEIIAEMIKDVHISERVPYDNFAVLFRSNGQSRPLEIAFKRLRIPYRIVGSTSFYSRAEIQDAIAYLKILANPKDDMSLQRILNVPPRGIGSKSIEKLREMRRQTGRPMTELIGRDEFWSQLPANAANGCREFSRVYLQHRDLLVDKKEKLMPGCRRYLNDIGYLSGLMKIYKKRKEAEMRLDNVQEFLNDVAEYQENENSTGTLRDYLLRFTLFDDGDKMEGEGVSMLTVHSSKGLEFEHVFVVGLEEELFPHAQSVSEGGVEEERRLFYVAVTRAKKELNISWARKRKVYGKDKERRLSRFIRELPEDVIAIMKQDDVVKPADAETVEAMLAKLKASL